MSTCEYLWTLVGWFINTWGVILSCKQRPSSLYIQRLLTAEVLLCEWLEIARPNCRMGWKASVDKNWIVPIKCQSRGWCARIGRRSSIPRKSGEPCSARGLLSIVKPLSLGADKIATLRLPTLVGATFGCRDWQIRWQMWVTPRKNDGVTESSHIPNQIGGFREAIN